VQRTLVESSRSSSVGAWLKAAAGCAAGCADSASLEVDACEADFVAE
jgi:hypothetical protein